MLTSGGSSANTTWLAALKSSPVPAAVTDSRATRMVGSDLKRCTTYGFTAQMILSQDCRGVRVYPYSRLDKIRGGYQFPRASDRVAGDVTHLKPVSAVCGAINTKVRHPLPAT